MTEQEINNILALIETTLINEEQPDFIEVSHHTGIIYVMCAKKDYKGIPLYERIQKIQALLEFDHEDVLDQFPVIVETLDLDQLTQLLAAQGKQ